ncbi:hypothetical protein PFICI_04302 [Pestalotiopsis fici W106-1]|uniref:Uncharacterized protein n=1 Tax=Pestalotiopsis fici (strain W106-1 / CGMCC3.15140) TaxID=1229662 RepID=W3XB61_PESFW|nr:uncharacterized protein PFICI_04302 [Pestalotiopsis fici W106-1]ETS82426.1 hypothetical protein PFICI_04302 [Pestalotiopsis fici W106-1]
MDSAATEQFASFAERNGIRRVFVHIDPDLSVADFEAFVARCAAQRVDVEALMGDPGWVLNPHHESFTGRLAWVVAYQARHKGNPAMQIRGLHLDIEPWHLPGWEANKSRYMHSFLQVIHNYTQQAHAMTPPLPVTADLPFWLHTVPPPPGCGGDYHVDALLSTLDGAVFMTYRNTPAVLADIAGPALAAAARHPGKSMDLAVETRNCDEEGRHISYHGLGLARLEADLAVIEGRMVPWADRHRIGVVVHDYQGWTEMR